MDITPGSQVSVEIARPITNEAARKTITRIFKKDPSVLKAHRKTKERRPSWEEWRRGGMQWHHQMKSRQPVNLDVGATYNIKATVDVIRDLASVERFVKVS